MLENYFMERIYSGRIGGPMGLLDPHFRLPDTRSGRLRPDTNMTSTSVRISTPPAISPSITFKRLFSEISIRFLGGIAALGAAASNGIKVSLGGTDEARKALQPVLTQECGFKTDAGPGATACEGWQTTH
ncbi:MAG: hypothetical protein IPJ30_23085 [Acidobacteria bacterium]|nr:hypothetical protein [Acidobacteriota bacterium]